MILVAKTSAAYDYLKKLFQQREVEKEYLALVHKVPEKKHDIINLPLEKVPQKQKMSVRDGSAPGGKVKEAMTEYWVLKEGKIDGLDQVALIRVKLHTGRTHQIRAHLSYIGHPIIGDEVYGKEYKQQDLKIIDRQFLHAYRLKFRLMDSTWLELDSELPEDLKSVLNRANINY